MSDEPPNRELRFRLTSWLTSTRSRVVAVVSVVVLLAAGTGTLLAQPWSHSGGQPSHLAAQATATPSPTATATAMPLPTATPKPRPTATPKPSGPVNYLVVHIGGCGSFPYPSLYFTNTDPGRFEYLFWNQTYSSSNQFYLRGNEGAEIYYGHTEEVKITPDTSPSAGPLTFTVTADRVQGTVDYGRAGYWHGTVKPCR